MRGKFEVKHTLAYRTVLIEIPAACMFLDQLRNNSWTDLGGPWSGGKWIRVGKIRFGARAIVKGVFVPKHMV